MSNEQKVLEKNVVVENDGDYTLTNVPLSARKHWLPVFIVLLGFTFLSTTMAAGAGIGTSFKFSELILILIVGNLILSTYTGILCFIGAKSGLNSVLLSKYALGKIGSKWADIMLGGTQIVWYAVQTAYMGLVFTKGLGLEEYFVPITIFWGLFMGATAIKGTRGMEIVAYLSIPPFLYLAYKLPQLSISAAGGFSELTTIIPSNPNMTFITAITVVIGTFISGGTNSTNWGRFAKSPKSGFVSGFSAFFIGTLVMVAAGMLGGLAIQQGDMIEIMIQMGIVTMAIIILIFNIWTTNTATAYAFGVAGAEFFNKSSKVPFVIGGVIIGTIMAVLGVYDFFIPFLVSLGVFIPPLGGLIIGDYLFNWRKGYPKIEDLEFKTVKVSNLIAYLVATLGAYVSSITGFGIPTINGIVLSVVLVGVFKKVFENSKKGEGFKIKENAEYI